MAVWYSFRAKDRTVRGYCRAEDEESVCKFAGKAKEEMAIKKVVWDGKEFKDEKVAG